MCHMPEETTFPEAGYNFLNQPPLQENTCGGGFCIFLGYFCRKQWKKEKFVV